MHDIHLQSKLPLLDYDLREPVLNQSIATQTNKQTKTYLEMQRQTNMLNKNNTQTAVTNMTKQRML